jgi:hypothetical protein
VEEGGLRRVDDHIGAVQVFDATRDHLQYQPCWSIGHHPPGRPSGTLLPDPLPDHPRPRPRYRLSKLGAGRFSDSWPFVAIYRDRFVHFRPTSTPGDSIQTPLQQEGASSRRSESREAVRDDDLAA